jgi:hypothetical protein
MVGQTRLFVTSTLPVLLNTENIKTLQSYPYLNRGLSKSKLSFFLFKLYGFTNKYGFGTNQHLHKQSLLSEKQ